MDNETKITYYGQSLFVIESQSSIKIGIDPYGKFTRPVLPSLTADIVLITHNHPDHANISLFKDSPTVIKVPGITNVKGIDIEGIPTYHDNLRGFLRGKNIIFKFEVDGIVFAHLGDIGLIPAEEVINKLLNVDVLMIPIGGTFTIDYKKAYEIINEFDPKVVIPMHYREKDSKIKILDNLDNFLNLVKDYKMMGHTYKMMDHSVSIKKDDLPVNTEIWVLKSS
jgi:L-ascorbate metabolism protein UlaG (beta-lactamase superfamily)